MYMSILLATMWKIDYTFEVYRYTFGLRCALIAEVGDDRSCVWIFEVKIYGE